MPDLSQDSKQHLSNSRRHRIAYRQHRPRATEAHVSVMLTAPEIAMMTGALISAAASLSRMHNTLAEETQLRLVGLAEKLLDLMLAEEGPPC
jgi:hypothetical protein